MDPSNLIDLTPLRPQRHQDDAGEADMPPPLGEEEDYVTGAGGAAAAGLHRGAALRESLPTQRREDLSYLWGTGIAVEVFRAEFRNYLENFTLSDVSSPASPLNSRANTSSASMLRDPTTAFAHRSAERFYLAEMLRMHLQGRQALELDLEWMSRAAPTMYQQTIHHPTECLQIMTAVAEEVYRDELRQRHGIVVPNEFMLTIAPKRVPHVMALKELSPANIEQLLGIKGMVIRVSKVIPEIRVACFECWHCRFIERSVSGDKGRIFEPTRCPHCGQSYSFYLQHNLSIYEDKQLIKVQEAPEHVSDGDTPISITVVVYGSMVDAVVPGDRVLVTGIYRSVPIRLNSNTRIIKSIFSTHVDAVHIELSRATRLSEDKSSNNSRLHTTLPTLAGGGGHDAGGRALSRAELMDTARMDMFYRLAHRPDIYTILLNSLARSIWGHHDVKRGLLCQLFGGTPKRFVFSHSSGSREVPTEDAARVTTPSLGNTAFFRSELNVILCGDPGVAKSQLLTQVHEIAPRGIYTSGKGSSSVGLTAFVVQDHDTGELVLEPGALVLSDQGLCCIDEFDKMNDTTRSVLHEVMEQQTLSIAKAGIIAQLNARTAILAAANPKESQWNVHLNVVENLQLEPTLLSRFDLIYLLLDRHDPAEDRRLASHVLAMYMDKSGGQRTRRALQEARRASSSEAEGDSEDDAPTAQRASPVPLAAGAAAGEGEPSRVIDAVTGLPEEVLLQLDEEYFLLNSPSGPYIPPKILSEYIAIAREVVLPKLTEEAHKQLATAYVELRRARGSSRTVSATLRQLESMIRLAEAHAKMRFGAEVLAEDVDEAKRLISAALKEAATDPKTGLISLDLFHAPDPTRNTVEGNMKRLEEVVERRYRAQGRHTAPVAELRLALNEHMTGGLRPVAPAQFAELLALMSGGDVIRSFTGATVTFD